MLICQYYFTFTGSCPRPHGHGQESGSALLHDHADLLVGVVAELMRLGGDDADDHVDAVGDVTDGDDRHIDGLHRAALDELKGKAGTVTRLQRGRLGHVGAIRDPDATTDFTHLCRAFP